MPLLVVERARRIGGEQVGEADDVGERRAQLVADVLDEGVLEPVGGLQRIVLFLEHPFVIGALGDIHEGHHGLPVGQARHGIVDQLAVGAVEATFLVGARRVEIDDLALEAAPDGGAILGQHLAHRRRDLVDMRILLEEVGGQLPQERQPRIAEREPAVGAEHRHRLVECVESGALHIKERAVLALQGELLGDVLEDVDDAALGAGRSRNDLDGAAIGQVPGLALARPAELVAGEMLGAPGVIVGLGGQLALGPELVEDGALVHARLQPVRIDAPQLQIGAVGLHQLAPGAEDGDGGGEGIDDARQMRQARIALGGIDARLQVAGGPSGDREFHQVEGAGRADADQPGARPVGGERGAVALLLLGVEQFGWLRLAAPAPKRAGEIEIGGIAEDELARSVAEEGGFRQPGEHGAGGGEGGRLTLRRGDRHTRHLREGGPDAHRDAAAQHPARGAHQAAITGAQAEIEAAAIGAECRERLGQCAGISFGQPRGEIEQRLDAPAGRQDHRMLAEEFRAVGILGPQHHDLGQARQHGLVLIDQRAQPPDLLVGTVARGAALAQQLADQRGGEQREAAGAERNGERHGTSHEAGIKTLGKRGRGDDKGSSADTSRCESPTDPDDLRRHATAPVVMNPPRAPCGCDCSRRPLLVSSRAPRAAYGSAGELAPPNQPKIPGWDSW